jgi:hypothetical protein
VGNKYGSSLCFSCLALKSPSNEKNRVVLKDEEKERDVKRGREKEGVRNLYEAR